jgi:hypothetical protein
MAIDGGHSKEKENSSSGVIFSNKVAKDGSGGRSRDKKLKKSDWSVRVEKHRQLDFGRL